jgi:F-type H+-transporting ATPase subunit delta
MMQVSEVASRYSKALFALSVENKSTPMVLDEIRELATGVEKDPKTLEFFEDPTVPSATQKEILSKLGAGKAMREEVKGLLSILAQNSRFGLLREIVTGFQELVDESNGVARGEVVSCATLFPDDRTRLEATIAKYTGRKVVLEYKEDKSLLGGLVARVGSFTFDDSLDTQLRLLREALKKESVLNGNSC